MRKVCVWLIVMLMVISLMVACGGGGGGGESPPVDGGGGGSSISPTTPTGLSAVVDSDTQTTLSWNASSDDSAVVAYQISGGVPSQVGTSTPSYTFTALTPDTQYCFTVLAIDDEANFSAPSVLTCATTDPAPISPWVTVREGVDYSLDNILWTGNKLVAISTGPFGSEILTSDDAVTWSKHIASGINFQGSIDSVTYGDGKFVGFSTWNYTSTDGIAWTRDTDVTDDPTYSPFDIAWSPDLSLFVAVGDSGEMHSSPTGTDWTQVNHGFVLDRLTGIEWLNDRFFAVGAEETILSSTDGITWTLVNSSPAPAPFAILDSVAWNGKSGIDSVYVATGTNNIFTSTDGVTWAAGATPFPLDLSTVVWGSAADTFVVIGFYGGLFTSSDGINWTERFDPAITSTFYDLVWTGSVFAVTGDMGKILTSPDGVSWENVAFGGDLAGIEWDGSDFIALGESGRMVFSSNSTDWTYSYMGSDNILVSDIAWNDAKDIYLAEGYTASLHSTDLTTWYGESGNAYGKINLIFDGTQFVHTGFTAVRTWDGITMQAGTDIPDWKLSLDISKSLYDIHWDGSLYVTVGIDGVVYTSDDVLENSPSWTTRTSGVTAWLYAITKANGLYVAVGDSGTIITSPDGVTWTARTSGTNYALNDVTWTGSEYVAVGQFGTILTSPDAVDWSFYCHDFNMVLNKVVVGGGSVVIAGDGGVIIRKNI